QKCNLLSKSRPLPTPLCQCSPTARAKLRGVREKSNPTHHVPTTSLHPLHILPFLFWQLQGPVGNKRHE
uniref:Uncharacterized protein n=1 Tax=Anser brachyrhynchus TaxID=132585 RepID=A0A8B9BBC1_9AVES